MGNVSVVEVAFAETTIVLLTCKWKVSEYLKLSKPRVAHLFISSYLVFPKWWDLHTNVEFHHLPPWVVRGVRCRECMTLKHIPHWHMCTGICLRLEYTRYHKREKCVETASLRRIQWAGKIRNWIATATSEGGYLQLSLTCAIFSLLVFRQGLQIVIFWDWLGEHVFVVETFFRRWNRVLDAITWIGVESIVLVYSMGELSRQKDGLSAVCLMAQPNLFFLFPFFFSFFLPFLSWYNFIPTDMRFREHQTEPHFDPEDIIITEMVYQVCFHMILPTSPLFNLSKQQ